MFVVLNGNEEDLFLSSCAICHNGAVRQRLFLRVTANHEEMDEIILINFIEYLLQTTQMRMIRMLKF